MGSPSLQLFQQTRVVTPAQILKLAETPVSLLQNVAVGYANIILGLSASLEFGGVQYIADASFGNQNATIAYAQSLAPAVASAVTNSSDLTQLLTSSASAIQNFGSVGLLPRSAIEAQGVWLLNGNPQPVDLTLGNGSLAITILYFIMQL